MEFLDQLTKNSVDSNLHRVAGSNIQTNRELSVDIYQHPHAFTKLVSDTDFDKIPTGSFLAELNDTKHESSVHFSDEIFHCKEMKENAERQGKQNDRTDHPKQDFLPVLNLECSYNAVISLFPFVCGVCEKKFDCLPDFFEHLSLHNEVTKLLHCCSQTNIGSFQEENKLYTCGICGIMYPSLCMLYKHMLNVEKVNDFVYKSKEKTVYAHKDNVEKCPVEKLSDMQGDELDENNKTSMNSTELERDTQNIIENSDNDFIHVSEHIKTRKASEKITKDQKTRQPECIKNECKKISKHKKLSKVLKNDARKKDKIKKSRLDAATESDQIMDGDLSVEVLAEWKADSDKNVDDLKISEPWTDTNENKQTSYGDTGKKPTNLKNMLFPCEVCGGFYKHQNLQKHRTTHDERTLACDQCTVVFKSQFRLNAHKKQVHVDEKKFTCDVCGKSFKAWPYLKQHRQIHKKDRDIPCPLCPIKFPYKALLRAHLVTHSDDKPHECNICERTFKRVDRLNAHKKYFHSEERNFSCPKCNKTFKTRDAMNRHHRIHLPPKYFCHVCGKGFVQKYNMRIHQNVHGMNNAPSTEICEQLL